MYVKEMTQDNLMEMCLPFRLSPMKTVRKWLYRTTSALENVGPFLLLKLRSTPTHSAPTACLPSSPRDTYSSTAPAWPWWSRWWCWWRNVSAWWRQSISMATLHRLTFGQNFLSKIPLSQDFQHKKKKSYFTILRKITDYSVWNVKWVYNILRERWFTK